MERIEIAKFVPLSYLGQEAVNTLCTHLSFTGKDMKIILTTSTHEGEGKSFVVMNAARTMAKLGKRVVVLDADLRRSSIGADYGLRYEEGSAKHGVAHVLAGMAESEAALYKTDIPGMYIMPVGRNVSNPLPLLNSARFGQLMEELAYNFDYVFVDAPPVGVVIDAAEIAKHCDGTLLVVRYNDVRYGELVRVKEQMEQTGCPIIGTVLNRVEMDANINRKYYYRSQYTKYGEHDEQNKQSKDKKNKKK